MRSVCLTGFVAGVMASSLGVAAPLRAQGRGAPPLGAIEGLVSTQNGGVRLPGAVVSVFTAAGVQVTQQLSDAEGRFRVQDLPDGRYRLVASLVGFQTVDTIVGVTRGRTATVVLDLPIADVSERVDVVAPLTASGGSADTVGTSDTIADKEREQFAPSGGLQAALRLLASAIDVPGGMSIKGGRPNQAGVQIGAGTLIDPTTGLVHLTLPADAIDTVAVLPNPYAVEFGRFSSGLVVIETRRAGDRWRLRLNDLDPDFRTKRHQDFKVMGLKEFGPRLEVGGPLIKDRLFLEQTAQYHYMTAEVPSRPEHELRTDQWFSTFTRVDANVSGRHSLVATGGLFPSRSRDATLGTFVPPDATVDLHERIGHGAVTERAIWSPTLLSESTVRVQKYRTAVEPQGAAPMELLPETTLGNFFNRQDRVTTTFQWINTVSMSHEGPGGLHLVKLGFDLLHSRYEGASASAPVRVERPDGSLARRLDFSGPTVQDVRSTDVAVFAQDRLQPTARWFVEFGGRIDRDGVLDRVNATPRAGAAVLLTRSGSAVMRGGYGLFYERTPSVAGAFDEFETAVDTRFAPDGRTPLGPPLRFAHVVAPGLRTPRSATWNLAVDHRFSSAWSVHAGLLDRRGSNELLVEPIRRGAEAELQLNSDGRSSYREAELGVHFRYARATDINATYVHASSRGDLNAFTNFFGSVLWPIVGVNAYAPTNADLPHRLLVRGRTSPTPRWLLLGIADWHAGFPYSVVDEMLDFVPPRNTGHRFPNALRLQLGVERRFKVMRWNPWVGVRVTNLLNAFLPTDVQSNIASPAFGSLYNSEYRKLKLIVRFAR